MSVLFRFLPLLFVDFTSASQDPPIVIIGAGPSGIAAASKLFESGFKNVKILEAEDQIGGRIRSVKFGDAFVDVGAEYCHGEEGNAVYNLVKEKHILKPISAKRFLTTAYLSNGSKLEDSLSEELQELILGYGRYDDSKSGFNKTGASFKDFFEDKYKKFSGDILILKNALGFAEKVSLTIDGAFSWSKTSAAKHYERCNGYQLLVWGGRGYKTIYEVLMETFPKTQRIFHLVTKVDKIIWNDSKVIVKSLNKTFEADRVIFTPSLGVLKESSGNLFEPPLPEIKEQAIKSLGFDGIMKIIMLFQEKWWKEDDIIFSLIWDEEELKQASKEGISWVSAFTLLAQIPGNPRVLTAWLTTDLIEQIEKLDKDTIKKGCNFVLKKFFDKDYNITEPLEVITSNWRSNPNFRGTYSYEKAGLDVTGISYQKHLSEPLKNAEDKEVLLFAGEATNPIHYSTVHGAVETGFREAQRIIDSYKNIPQ